MLLLFRKFHPSTVLKQSIFWCVAEIRTNNSSKNQNEFHIMNGHDSNKQKYKRPKHKTLSTTSPEPPVVGSSVTNVPNGIEPKCPLLAARDSEWVDILQTASDSSPTINDDEAVLQLVECEEGPQMKPLMLMFPQLLEEDPEMVEGMLNKAMSTTEVTKHLVGQKANFEFMKKVKRLIPTDKKWLDSLSEQNTSGCSSIESSLHSDILQIDYAEADTDSDEEQNKLTYAKQSDLK